MAKIALIYCIIMFVIGYIFEPRKINPITVFYGEWSVIIFLAILNLFSLVTASDFIYGYILVGCIFFSVGFYLIKILKSRCHILSFLNPVLDKFQLKISLNQKMEEDVHYILNSKITKILISFSLLFFIVDSLDAFVALLHGNSLDMIREQAQEGNQYLHSDIMNAIRILIATPVSFAVMPLAAIQFFKEKKDIFVIVSAIAIALLRVISDGGRTPFIFLALCFILCYFYQVGDNKSVKKERNDKTRDKKRTIQFAFAMMLGVLFLGVVTLSRSGTETIRYTYYYFAMEPIMFEKWAANVDAAGLVGYGMASFNGFLFPLFYVLKNMFHINYPEFWRNIYDMIESVGTEWQVINTNGLTANSYVSAFWNLYLDGRLIGIIIGMLLYGVFVAVVYMNVLYKQNDKKLSIFCLVMLGVFYSFQFIIFENIYYSLAFILLVMFFYRRAGSNSGEMIQ